LSLFFWDGCLFAYCVVGHFVSGDVLEMIWRWRCFGYGFGYGYALEMVLYQWIRSRSRFSCLVRHPRVLYALVDFRPSPVLSFVYCVARTFTAVALTTTLSHRSVFTPIHHHGCFSLYLRSFISLCHYTSSPIRLLTSASYPTMFTDFLLLRLCTALTSSISRRSLRWQFSSKLVNVGCTFL
jgi:hypothetical protein